MGGDGCGLDPCFATDEFGHAEVDDAQASIGSEHELRRRDFGVGDTALMGGVEGPARFEADDERLGGLEEPAAIEQVAQAAATEVFDHPEHRGLAVEFDVAPVEDGCDVGMPERAGHLSALAELAAEGLVLSQIRLDDLEGDRLGGLDIEGRADDRVGPCRHDLDDAIPPNEHAIDQVVDAVACRCVPDYHREKLPPGLSRVVPGVWPADLPGMMRV